MYYLIGKDLSYSISKDIHNLVNNNYSHLEIKKEEEVVDFLKKRDFRGINITIPYKKIAAQNVDELVGYAKDTKIVNTIINKDNKLYGYNTDVDGVIKSLNTLKLNYKKEKFLILGTGATSKTVFFALNILGAKDISFCGRKSDINYKNVYQKAGKTTCIINTTPIGMKYDIYKKPINIKKFSNLKAVFDVIYSPNKTILLQDTEEKNIKTINGLDMLLEQARKAEEIFLDKKIDENIFDNFKKKLLFNNLNITLIGLSGVGKTEIAKLLSKKLNKKLIDTDRVLCSYFGYQDPKEMIEDIGLEKFREKETYIVKGISTYKSSIISTGGGVYTKKENIRAINLNSIVFCINRDFSLIDKTKRPLYEKISPEDLYKKRKRFYNLAHYKIENNSEIEKAVDAILEILGKEYEI